jgi:type IV pilus assembly protein PilA
VSAALPKVCESQTSKYVASVAVDGNGVITVVGNHEALRGSTSASTNTIALTPLQTGDTPVNGSTDGGKTISGWRCGPASSNGLPVKYLPASCKAS